MQHASKRNFRDGNRKNGCRKKITDSRKSYVKAVEGNLLEGFCAGAGTSSVTDWR